MKFHQNKVHLWIVKQKEIPSLPILGHHVIQSKMYVIKAR